MDIKFSARLTNDLLETLQTALAKQRIVNIPQLAEEIRRRNEADNIALEDIQAQLMTKAQLFSAMMEFDTPLDASQSRTN